MAKLAVVLLPLLLLIVEAASAGKDNRSGWLTTTVTGTVAPTTINPGNPGGPADAINTLLLRINSVRQSYGVAPVVLDATLTAKALTCANELILKAYIIPDISDVPSDTNVLCKMDEPALQYFQHGAINDIDEQADFKIVNIIADAWIDNEELTWQRNRVGDARYTDETRHFTQIVWQSLKSIGCAVSTQTNLAKNRKLLFCYFDPPGNTQYGGSNVEVRKNIGIKTL